MSGSSTDMREKTRDLLLAGLPLLALCACRPPHAEAPTYAPPTGEVPVEAGMASAIDADMSPTGPNVSQDAQTALEATLCAGAADCTDKGSQAFDRQDFALAHRYYERACELNNADACEALALSLSHGHENAVTRDERRAIEVMQKACDLRNLKACWILGNMYRQGSTEPSAYPRDLERTFKIWQRTCRAGEAGSCASLADCYTEGWGVKRNAALGQRYRWMAEELGYAGE